MKKVDLVITFAICLILLGCVGCIAKMPKANAETGTEVTDATTTEKVRSTHPKAMIIVAVDREADIVTLSTCSGLLYEFYGVQDYEEGDIVALIMDDNGTEDVRDDIILAHQYCGWPEKFDEVYAEYTEKKGE